MLLPWLVETCLLCWETAIEEDRIFTLPGYFEIDWVRYCEEEFEK